MPENDRSQIDTHYCAACEQVFGPTSLCPYADDVKSHARDLMSGTLKPKSVSEARGLFLRGMPDGCLQQEAIQLALLELKRAIDQYLQNNPDLPDKARQ